MHEMLKYFTDCSFIHIFVVVAFVNESIWAWLSIGYVTFTMWKAIAVGKITAVLIIHKSQDMLGYMRQDSRTVNHKKPDSYPYFKSRLRGMTGLNIARRK